MTSATTPRVAIIGGGISGIATASILQRCGYQPVVFEKSASPGGVWSVAYPGVRLQNIASHYHLARFPWPFTPDFHPSGEQIMRYLRAAIEQLRLDVRLQHEVLALEEQPDGWLVRYRGPDGVREERFAYAVVSVGQYTDGKQRPRLPGQEQFQGQVITEREVQTLDTFSGRRVAVVGFGKSALDMVTFAATRAAQVSHIFRTPRWLVPEWLLGLHVTHALFTRFGAVMVPCWDYPTAGERFLHTRLGPLVGGFWRMIGALFRWQALRNATGKGAPAQARLRAVLPRHPLLPDMRAAAALEPERYYALVAEGRIQPCQGELAGFTPGGLRLKDGREIGCDLAVLALGSHMATYPFMPEPYRRLLECDDDGTQLYRHLIHPRIPRLGFAGLNHGFMHVPAVEVGALWLAALWRGELELPGVAEMEHSIDQVRAWKRQHIHFEPSRLSGVNTRFLQYLDVLLKDLGLSPYRKLPNVFAEVFGRYRADDYAGALAEYQRAQARRAGPLRPLPVNT